MRPTIAELIRGVSWALDERVRPNVEDKWANSHLQSIGSILRHVAVRSEGYQQILIDDIEDQKELLSEARSELAGQSAFDKLTAEIDQTLSADWPEHKGHRLVRSLEDESFHHRNVIDQLVIALHEAADTDSVKDLHQKVVDYLRRQIEREAPLFEDTFIGRPF
ncbi:MAG: hypothetical protein HOC70_14760 [Gammaproteobacteria bacterium]|jgi:hypothetical protein|nr:hypothetical protein [Gammaproteobacteria bacterium]MBT4494501.1 hypothetical protein [Gammaproteobacteria bacterium]